MKKIILTVMAIVGLTGATTAFSADDGWYALIGAGQATGNALQSNLDSALRVAGGTGFTSTYSAPTVYKLEAGYQINKNFAVEGGYLASNNASYSATGGNLGGTLAASAKVTGWNVTAVGILPLSDQFSLLGKLGVAALDESATATGGGVTASASGSKTDSTYGLGAKYDFTKEVFGRLDVDSYNVGSSAASTRITVWTVDVGYKF